LSNSVLKIRGYLLCVMAMQVKDGELELGVRVGLGLRARRGE
jgi:hypothetical protein